MTPRQMLRLLSRLVGGRPGRHSATYLATDTPYPSHGFVPSIPENRPFLTPPDKRSLVPMPPVSYAMPSSRACSVVYVDPPTLRLPRVPVEDRVPVFWDTDPAPPYVPRHYRDRWGDE